MKTMRTTAQITHNVLGPDTTTLVTGGSSGIGKQIAADLLGLGATVIICSSRLDRVEQAVRELSTISPRIAGLKCDIGDPSSVRAMAGRMLGEHGCPDLLVNNAGFATYRTIANSDLAEIERLFSVNLLGAVRCTK